MGFPVGSGSPASGGAPRSSPDQLLGGLGGCPFAPGAKGNVATEDVVLLCESMGYQTGIHMPKLLESVALLSELFGAPQGGRSHYWLSRQSA